jgi:choline dehydrogenase-like flavoprotein
MSNFFGGKANRTFRFHRIMSKYSVKTVIDLPSVGENLQDQPNVLVGGSSTRTFSGYPPYVTFVNATDLFGSNTTDVFNSVLSELPAYAKAIASASNNALEATNQEILLRSQVDLMFKKSVPIVEFLPVVNSSPTGTVIASVFWSLLPFARGSVHMSGAEFNASPSINPNFFMVEWDHKVQVAAARLARKSLSTRPLADLVDVELIPGADVPLNASDAMWLSWLKDHCGCLIHIVSLMLIVYYRHTKLPSCRYSGDVIQRAWWSGQSQTSGLWDQQCSRCRCFRAAFPSLWAFNKHFVCSRGESI